jgi:hypothetical protein
MKIAPFKVEEWMNEYEMDAEYNIAETCVESLTVEELLNFSDDPAARLEEIKKLQLTYCEAGKYFTITRSNWRQLSLIILSD